MRGATIGYEIVFRRKRISIHAPHARSDACRFCSSAFASNFNPRSSCEERRLPPLAKSSYSYFNPRSSCEERLWYRCPSLVARNFNPRSSCEERLNNLVRQPFCSIFQSTLLMRGATSAASKISAAVGFQSTLLMRGATCRQHVQQRQQRRISIHAPHARSDGQQSDERPQRPDISIHAPHARSDKLQADILTALIISIHAPHARSDLMAVFLSDKAVFQSTLLMRGATRVDGSHDFRTIISIHAPHARSDVASS